MFPRCLPPCQCEGVITGQIQRNSIITSKALKFAQWKQSCLLINSDLLLQTDLYSSSLLTQALTSSEGSLASRLIQERADMLQIELPSLTTRRLALVSFPVVGSGGTKPAKTDRNRSAADPPEQTYSSEKNSL